MNTFGRIARRAIASPLAALMLTLGVAVPLVERADASHLPAAESEHQPGTCPAPHDHTVCTQYGANHAAPGDGAAERPVEIVHRVRVARPADRVLRSRVARSRSARAPPSL